MKPIRDSLVGRLEALGFTWRPTSHKAILGIGFAGSPGGFRGLAIADEDLRLLVVESISPYCCPRDRFSAACEYMARANSDSLVPGLVIHPSSGRISFRTGIDARDAELSDQLIDRLLAGNLTSFVTYLRGLLMVTFDHADPEAALGETLAVKRRKREARRSGVLAGSEEDLAESHEWLLQTCDEILAEDAAREAGPDEAK